MILLDTHIFVWLADEHERLKPHREKIDQHRADGLGISVISCWEIAKLVEYNRLKLACPVEEWIDAALALSSLHVFELTPEIAIASTQLPRPFHKDPADQIIVATARIYDLALLSEDSRILEYEHVVLV